jgi:transcription elongation factor GreA
MAKEFKMSKERLQALEEELQYLRTTREREVAELIKEARSFGDLSENSEYDEAKTEQAKLYGRIAEVENILANAVVIDESELDSGRVGMNSKVTIKDLEFGDEETYTIVGSQEANPAEGKISDDSPIGRVVIGKVAGDILNVEAPGGTFQYQLISVE